MRAPAIYVGPSAATIGGPTELRTLEHCLVEARRVVEQGGHVFQQFTCFRCGTLGTLRQCDIFFDQAECDRCHSVTNIRVHGCGYIVIWDMSAAAASTPRKSLTQH